MKDHIDIFSYKVNSIKEEYEIIKGLKCKCGGNYDVWLQELIKDALLDSISVECDRCSTKARFEFDISSFFGKINPFTGKALNINKDNK